MLESVASLRWPLTAIGARILGRRRESNRTFPGRFVVIAESSTRGHLQSMARAHRSSMSPPRSVSRCNFIKAAAQIPQKGNHNTERSQRTQRQKTDTDFKTGGNGGRRGKRFTGAAME